MDAKSYDLNEIKWVSKFLNGMNINAAGKDLSYLK